MKKFTEFFNLILEEKQAATKVVIVEAADYISMNQQDRIKEITQSLKRFSAIYPEFQADLDALNANAYLTGADELELLKIYKNNELPEHIRNAAKELVILNKLGFLINYVKRGSIKLDRQNDIVGDLVIGLNDLIEKFDPEINDAFTPYVKSSINGLILNAINPNRQQSVSADANGRNGEMQVSSIDAEISGDRGEWADKDQTLADKLEDLREGIRPDETLAKDEIRDLLEDMLLNDDNTILTTLEKQVLLGVNEGKKDVEIAKELNITPVYVGILRKKAITKISNAFKS